MKPLSRTIAAGTPVESETILRALAISAIVFNHANPVESGSGLGLGGGLTFLMLLSGYNLARFNLNDAHPAAFRRSCLMLAGRVILPTLAIVVLDWLVTWNPPRLGYIFFFSNWFTWEHPELLQIWYPQVLVEILLLFWLIFAIKPIAHLVRRHPFPVLVLAYGFAVGLRAISPNLLEPLDTRGRLINFYVWNFLLGMVAFYALHGPRNDAHRIVRRIAVVAAALFGAIVAFGPSKLDFWWLTIASALWVSFPRVRLPYPVVQVARIVSQAAFTVFLLHLFLLYIWRHLLLPSSPLAQFVFALGGSVAVWIVLTAFGRAYRAMRHGTLAHLAEKDALA